MKPLRIIAFVVAILGVMMVAGAGIAALALYGDLKDVLWTVAMVGGGLFVASIMAATYPG